MYHSDTRTTLAGNILYIRATRGGAVRWSTVGTAWAGLALLAVSCAAGAGPPADEGSAQRAVTPKRITIAIMSDPKALGLVDTGPLPGRGELEVLLNSALTVMDNQGVRRPQLAAVVPTVENGLWKVLPDGRMETTWKIRPGVEWHDGAPFSSQDLLFTTAIEQDRELPVRRNAAYNAIDSVEAVDPLTVTVKWKRIFLSADTMFGRGYGFADPRPKHLLERPYLEDKASFLALPYWTEGYVGTGPFKLTEWATGTHVLLQGNERYALGRPDITEIEVKFIPDRSTLIANILAGVVDLTMGRGMALEQATQATGRWDGRAAAAPGNPTVIFPKLTNPVPPALGEPRFRRALLHAIDRQQIVDTFLEGSAPIAHPGLRLTQEEIRELEPDIVKYEHDLRKAISLIEELGYTRGADSLLVDSGRQRLSLELHTDTSNDMHLKAQSVVADDWRRIGVGVETVVLPPQAQRESSWQWTFSSMSVRRNPIDLRSLESYFHSRQIPAAENNFSGRNYMAYTNRELDSLIDRFGQTVPLPERMAIARQIIHHVTDQVVILGLFYDIEITMIGSRLRNVLGRGPGVEESWNAHEWDVQ